ncbi:hypothetical protein ATKI12_0141 [Kitasatospora sp. Ki12]
MDGTPDMTIGGRSTRPEGGRPADGSALVSSAGSLPPRHPAND